MVSASNFISVDEGKFSLTANAFLPFSTIIPLEDVNEAADVLIKAGDKVKEGQIIARTKNSCIHSSVPGIVEEIFQGQYYNGKPGLCVRIKLQGSLSFTGKPLTASDYKSFEATTLSYIIKEAGIIQTFDKCEPLYKNLKSYQEKSDLVLVLRLFDDDPSRLIESFISRNYTKEVMTGCAILAKLTGAKTVIIADNKNNPINTEEYNSSFFACQTVFNTLIDTQKYPCGSKHEIVASVKKQFKEDSLKKLGKNDFFIDSLTALHVYNAVIFNKPVINNYVHVTGDCLNAAAIINVKIGTKLKDLVEQCGGFKRPLSKIIVNGTMQGTAVSSLDVPVSKAMKSIEFVPEKQIKIQHTDTCIRCGNCRKICPADIWPGNLFRISRLEGRNSGLLNSRQILESAILCQECGLCNSVCPARLPISQTIALLKENLNENK